MGLESINGNVLYFADKECTGITARNVSCDAGPCPIDAGLSNWVPVV